MGGNSVLCTGKVINAYMLSANGFDSCTHVFKKSKDTWSEACCCRWQKCEICLRIFFFFVSLVTKKTSIKHIKIAFFPYVSWQLGSFFSPAKWKHRLLPTYCLQAGSGGFQKLSQTSYWKPVSHPPPKSTPRLPFSYMYPAYQLLLSTWAVLMLVSRCRSMHVNIKAEGQLERVGIWRRFVLLCS